MHTPQTSLVLFLFVVLLFLAGAHYYLWVRLIRDPALPKHWRRGLTALIVALAVNLPASLALSRSVSPGGASAWLWTGLTWLGVLWFLFASLATLDSFHWVGLAAVRQRPQGATDPQRRVAMRRLLGLGAAGMGGGASLFALSEAGRIATQRVDVSLTRLPPGLAGMKIVQLSDVHVGPTIGRDFIEAIVAQVNALGPDIVAITGDLVDGSVETLRHAVEPLADLRSRFGTFFVTGNHEFYSGADEWCQHLGQLGIRVLRNESVTLSANGGSLCLAGVEDYHADRFGGNSSLATALKDRVPSQPVVLLAHQPRSVFEASDQDVDLQLSGHTHGGQLWPFNWLVRLQQPVIAGLELVGRTLVYVSRGTGYWGPPMRLGAPAEVTLLTLTTRVG